MKRKKYIDRLDYHHILFQNRHWRKGWAKTLRSHPYCGMYIPQNTLHREIHSLIRDIPAPKGEYCRMAVEALDSWLDGGLISLNDSLERRIEVLTWCFKAKCKATTSMLELQRKVVVKYKERY